MMLLQRLDVIGISAILIYALYKKKDGASGMLLARKVVFPVSSNED
jgi:hypothetical protein